jgi:histidinol-phosphate aminotransferase
MTKISRLQRLDRWLRPEIRALSAYHVTDATGMVKLDAMENPYGWPQSLVEQWLQALSSAELNRYPDPEARSLVAALRRVHDIPEQSGVLLGNGSDELIQLIMQAVAAPDRVVLAPEPGFSMYQMIASFVGLGYVGVPLCRQDFSLDVAAMLAAIEQHQPAVVFLAYPNNPTGNLFDAGAMEQIIAAAPGLVVVDEAYHAFADATMMGHLADYDNLLLLRTLSKMGLAGLRLGLLVADSCWVDEINKIRLPYNINSLTQRSAEFAMQHATLLSEQTDRISRDREVLYQQLQALTGLVVYPSRANFIMFKAPAGRGPELFQRLIDNGVLIRNLHRDDSVLADCLRVTVGTADENTAFLTALHKVL